MLVFGCGCLRHLRLRKQKPSAARVLAATNLANQGLALRAVVVCHAENHRSTCAAKMVRQLHQANSLLKEWAPMPGQCLQNRSPAGFASGSNVGSGTRSPEEHLFGETQRGHVKRTLGSKPSTIHYQLVVKLAAGGCCQIPRSHHCCHALEMHQYRRLDDAHSLLYRLGAASAIVTGQPPQASPPIVAIRVAKS